MTCSSVGRIHCTVIFIVDVGHSTYEHVVTPGNRLFNSVDLCCCVVCGKLETDILLVNRLQPLYSAQRLTWLDDQSHDTGVVTFRLNDCVHVLLCGLVSSMFVDTCDEQVHEITTYHHVFWKTKELILVWCVLRIGWNWLAVNWIPVQMPLTHLTSSQKYLRWILIYQSMYWKALPITTFFQFRMNLFYHNL